MTRIGDITEVLQDMETELNKHSEWLRGQEIPEIDDAEVLQSLLDGSSYTIGVAERSEDMINNVLLWANKQQNDDAMKVSKFRLYCCFMS
jgi:hypothetical protein